MSDNPILWHIDRSNPFFLQTDVFAYRVRAILIQKDEKGKLYSVAYRSWLFDKSERNYIATERELLAIVYTRRK
jgi:hypothetical protein